MSIRVSSLVWEHAPVNGTDLLVLLVIADHASDDGTNSWPGRATIARRCRVTERSVKRSIARLRELGLIDVRLNAGGTADTPNDRRPNRYRVAVEKLGERGDTHAPSLADGGTPEVERGDARVQNGGTPVSPEPSLNHPRTSHARDDNVVQLWTDGEGRSWVR